MLADRVETSWSKESLIWRPSLVRAADTREGAPPEVQKPAHEVVVMAPVLLLHTERRQVRPTMGLHVSPTPVQSLHAEGEQSASQPASRLKCAVYA